MRELHSGFASSTGPASPIDFASSRCGASPLPPASLPPDPNSASADLPTRPLCLHPYLHIGRGSSTSRSIKRSAHNYSPSVQSDPRSLESMSSPTVGNGAQSIKESPSMLQPADASRSCAGVAGVACNVACSIGASSSKSSAPEPPPDRSGPHRTFHVWHDSLGAACRSVLCAGESNEAARSDAAGRRARRDGQLLGNPKLTCGCLRPSSTSVHVVTIGSGPSLRLPSS